MRIGLGTLHHTFDPRRVLVLGGVKVPGAWGLKGRGDGDVLSLCVAEALLGAAGLGDLEDHAPAAEARWREQPSAVVLADVVETLAGLGLAPAHVDATLEAPRPALRAQRPAMVERVASLLHLDAARVNVKIAPGDTVSDTSGIRAYVMVSLRESRA